LLTFLAALVVYAVTAGVPVAVAVLPRRHHPAAPAAPASSPPAQPWPWPAVPELVAGPRLYDRERVAA